MTAHNNPKRITTFYIIIQALYFTVTSLMFGYASAYLLNRGFSNSQIGAILGTANVFSACLQPGITLFVQKTNIRLGSCMAALYTVISVLAISLLVLPVKGYAFVIVITILFLLQSAMQPSVNSLYRGYYNQGIKINFGLARGFGSLAYSLTGLFTGQLLNRLTPDILPAMYLVPSVLIIIFLLLFHAPNIETGDKTAVTPKQKKLLLRQFPHFYLFLAGVVFLATTHVFVETYLLQIIHRIGGNSTNLGIAIAIASITELPAMVLYKTAYKKVGNRRLLCFAGWMWATKNFLIMIAPSIYIIYAAELLQFASFAIYVPASVRYIAHAIPETEFLKGQALAGSAYTVGSLIATFLGGQLIDLAGMGPTLWIIQIFSVAGVVLFTIATLGSLKVNGDGFRDS